jgi:hypothetical protein
MSESAKRLQMVSALKVWGGNRVSQVAVLKF